MVLLMESLTPRGASGARRYSPAAARHDAPQRSPLAASCIPEEADACAEEDAENAQPADASLLPACVTPAACSPAVRSTPVSAQRDCSPSPARLMARGEAEATPRCGSESMQRQPLASLHNALDALSLVAATPQPFHASSAGRPRGSPDFAFDVSVDVDLSSPLTVAQQLEQAHDCYDTVGAGSASGVAAEQQRDAAGNAPSRAAGEVFTSPVVQCAVSAASLCESVLTLGIGAIEETAAAALPRMQLARRAASARAASLAARMQASLDTLNASLDSQRNPAWLRRMMDVLELQAAEKDEEQQQESDDENVEEAGPCPPMTPNGLALLTI